MLKYPHELEGENRMKIHNIPTDETLRSLLIHGSKDFPFACYFDELDQFHSKSIEWHWHEEVEFSIVLDGNVLCYDELNVYELSKGDGLFLNSGTLHRFASNHNGTMVNMVFAPELIAPPGSLLYKEFVEKVICSDCSLLCFKSNDAKNLPIMKSMQALYDATNLNIFSIHNAASFLWEELLYVADDKFKMTQSKTDKLLRARIQTMVYYIHQNYLKHLTLDDIANAANISASEALRCFHSSMQTTPVNYLNQYRLECAKRLLLTTSDPVIRIALNTGFENSSYFCRVFKKKYGKSPNMYRKLYSYQS